MREKGSEKKFRLVLKKFDLAFSIKYISLLKTTATDSLRLNLMHTPASHLKNYSYRNFLKRKGSKGCIDSRTDPSKILMFLKKRRKIKSVKNTDIDTMTELFQSDLYFDEQSPK